MKKFEKEQPKLCQDILNNHINSNTEDYKRIIIRTMQTMGVLNDDVDSEDYMESDEILDIHTIKKITLEDDQDTNIQDE